MAGPPSNAFSQLTVRYRSQASPFPLATTHGFTTPDAVLGDVLLAIDDFATELVVQCSQSLTAVDVLWKVGPEATGPTLIVATNANGTLPGELEPPQVAVLTRLTPAGVSGRFAGRFYLPGIISSQIESTGLLTTAARNAHQLQQEAAYAAMAAVGADPVIFPASGSDPRPVEGLQVQQRCATQRRRNRR